MTLGSPRSFGPLEIGTVVLLHGVALSALLFTRIQAPPIGASAPIFGQIVQAPAAAAVPARSAAPQRLLPPLAMRSVPRKSRPVVPAPPPARPAPLASSAAHSPREVTLAAAKSSVRPPTPRPAPSPTRRAPPKPVAAAQPPPAANPTVPVAAPPAPTPPTPVATAAAPTAGAEPAPGNAGPTVDDRAYFAELLRQLNRFKVYPPALRKAKIEGRVVLTFTIDAQGRVIFSDVQRTSGHAALDDAAERMLTRASPLPAIPPKLGKTSLTLSVPIEYSLLTDR